MIEGFNELLMIIKSSDWLIPIGNFIRIETTQWSEFCAPFHDMRPGQDCVYGWATAGPGGWRLGWIRPNPTFDRRGPGPIEIRHGNIQQERIPLPNRQG
jgi:hypothetical protein